MLKKLKVHGFRTLLDTEVTFDPLTIMIGKNGAGKTSILDVLQIIGNFARGGAKRAFGPPPWSLSWQRTKGVGRISKMRFDVGVQSKSGAECQYSLALDERNGEPCVDEERVTRKTDHITLASFDWKNPPDSGTILNPNTGISVDDDVREIAAIFRSVMSFELNPSVIERGSDKEVDFVGRDGFGVAGFLAHIKDSKPDVFSKLEDHLKQFRPETEAIDVWFGGNSLFWGLRDRNQQHAFPAVHVSWGDRQLVGLLCVLYSTPPGSTIAIEEIDRGFHPSRYEQIIEFLTSVAYDGLDGQPPIQIVITTHSVSFVNKLKDRLDEVRMVTRVPDGGTIVRTLRDLCLEKLGTDRPEQPLGEIWEMGILDDVVEEAMG